MYYIYYTHLQPHGHYWAHTDHGIRKSGHLQYDIIGWSRNLFRFVPCSPPYTIIYPHTWGQIKTLKPIIINFTGMNMDEHGWTSNPIPTISGFTRCTFDPSPFSNRGTQKPRWRLGPRFHQAPQQLGADAALRRVGEAHTDAAAPEAPRAPGAVHIVVDAPGQVVVDHTWEVLGFYGLIGRILTFIWSYRVDNQRKFGSTLPSYGWLLLCDFGKWRLREVAI